MKLNYKRTFFVGLAFMSICAFWQVYDNVIPLILKDTFHVRDSYIGIVMAMDNVLALFMLPLFGKLSDKTRTKIGRRMPYILGGTILALLCLAIMPAAQKQNNALLFFIGLGLVLIAMATYRSPAVALMPDVTPKPLRSQGNAVINLMGAVGGMLMLLTMMIFPVTGDTPRYSAVFLVLGLVMAVCVAVLFWQIREPACVAEREAADRAAGSSDEDEGVTDAGGKMPRPMFRSLLFILASVFFWFFGYNAVTLGFQPLRRTGAAGQLCPGADDLHRRGHRLVYARGHDRPAHRPQAHDPHRHRDAGYCVLCGYLFPQRLAAAVHLFRAGRHGLGVHQCKQLPHGGGAEQGLGRGQVHRLLLHCVHDGADLYAHPLQYSDGACGLSHAVSLCRLLRVRQLCHDAVRAAR